jgi:26S proteasome regulatory subunit N9
LLYLAFTPIETLSVTQRQALAYDLGLAALCGEKQYQFGELLLHPILQSLQGTAAQWLVDMLHAFNAGDIHAFETVSKVHGAAIQAEQALVANSQRLREKIRIFALMQLVREMPAHSRTLPFADIATRTSLPEEEVELLLMRSLSLSLIKGSINQVEASVRVTWVQPRVMDREAIGKQTNKLKDWMEKVQRTSVFLANETPEILA